MHADSRRTLLLDVYAAACDAVDGRRRVRAQLAGEGADAGGWVLAIGKAACAMTLGALDAWGERVAHGLAVAPASAFDPELQRFPQVRFLPGEHPLPGAASLAAGEAVLRFAQAAPPGQRVLVLVSGGASSLVEVPAPGIDADALRTVHAWGLSSGVDVVQLNAVRRRLSRLKAGRLAAALAHCDARALLLSDVPGDDPVVIGSGLVAAPPPPPPPPTRRPRRGAPPGPPPLPEPIATILDRAGELPPGATLPCTLVGTLDDALAAAERALVARGYAVRRLPGRLAGDAETAAARYAHELAFTVEDVLVAGGETTVRLPPEPGRGGRNQHFALALARQLADHADLVVLAAGTDGVDGGSPDAGAIVDGGTRARGLADGLEIDAVLAAADSGRYLEATGDLLNTGPTGTNVGDLVIGLRRAPDPPRPGPVAEPEAAAPIDFPPPPGDEPG